MIFYDRIVMTEYAYLAVEIRVVAVAVVGDVLALALAFFAAVAVVAQ